MYNHVSAGIFQLHEILLSWTAKSCCRACWTLQTLKCHCSSPFSGLISDEPSHLLQFFQNLWHLHLFLLSQTCSRINEDTIYAGGAHTAKFSEQIIFQTLLCACVPSSGDKSTWAATWNFPSQVRNCQKHQVTPALAEEQTLHTAGSSARMGTEIKNIQGKKGSKLVQTWRATHTSILTFCTRQCWRFHFRKFSIKGLRFIPITSHFRAFPASFHFPQHSPHSWQRQHWLGVHGANPAGKAGGYSQCRAHGWHLSMCHLPPWLTHEAGASLWVWELLEQV